MDKHLKDEIVTAASRVLRRQGLGSWSVDLVAAEAGCAKGLVAYHHGSKRALLGAVGRELWRARQAQRVAALSGSGAEALDALWLVLTAAAREGESAALAALSAEPGIDTRLDSAEDLAALGAAIGRALDLPDFPPAEARLAAAALDGFELALLRGASEDAVHEAYHRLWLGLLS